MSDDPLPGGGADARSRVSKVLLVLGALVGCATGVTLALGLRLDRLPPWMIAVGMYKLAFLAAGGLFVAGALLGRAARNASRRRNRPGGQLHCGSDSWMESDNVRRHPEGVNRDRRDD